MVAVVRRRTDPEGEFCLECGAPLDGTEDFEDVCAACDTLWPDEEEE